MTFPAVSVIIPTFRRAHAIRGCLDSVLAQTEQDIEVIVVDDCSGDDTERVVTNPHDPRVRFIGHETNLGGNAARRTGIEQARGRWVAFLDSDDTWLPTKLERQLEGLAARAGYGMSYTWFDSRTPSGESLGGPRPRVEGLRCTELLIRNVVGTFSTLVVDRDVLTAVGGPDPSLRSCQDWDLFIRLNRLTPMTVVPEVLVHYLRDPDDPVRISTRRSSVVQGQRALLRKTAEHLGDMTPAEQAERGLRFMESFANAGATADVVRTARVVPASAWTSPSLAARAARLLARSEKRRRVTDGRIRQ